MVPFLRQSIESVLKQTFQEWELLIVDDCSTDDSAVVIEDFVRKDVRIRHFRTETSSGSPALPRNIGIEHAQGRYIAFLDSDDIWLPTKLENQLRLFAGVDVAIVYSDYEKISV